MSGVPATDPALTAVPAERYGPNTAEVTAFIESVHRLTPGQWRKVLAARQSVLTVTRDGSSLPAETVRALLGSNATGEATVPEPVANLARDLAGVLAGRSDAEAVAAWQAATALVRRRQLAALTFAAHYAPFASFIPAERPEEVAPIVRLFASALKWLGAPQWDSLARPWSLDRDASSALLQASLKGKARDAEEVVALAAIALAAKHVAGDAGWAAVKTAVHGARVLGSLSELTAEQARTLWVPLEEAIALRSLTEAPISNKPAKTAVRSRVKPAPAADRKEPIAPKRKRAASRAPDYGPNAAEVTAFVKAIPELTAIQWLRVLDRRELVASVTREGEDEPAGVVRSIIAALKGTAELEIDERAAVYSTVERAAFALAARGRLSGEDFTQHYGAIAEIIPAGDADPSTFAERVAALNPEEWTRLAAISPPADAAQVAPYVHAGTAISRCLDQRSDAEAVVAWHALAALIRRHQLSPIKFAVAYAPFASAVAVIRPRSILPVVQRYLTAVGRLSAHQCSVLAEPWLLADDVAASLGRATSGGESRVAEEAAALAALVTVPMRLKGDAGWAASKTATYGGRVIAVRAKLTDEELVALWKPLERAIPMSSLAAASKPQ